MNAATYWERLKETGWLNHIPSSEHDSLRKGIADNFRKKPTWAFLALTQAGFDTESFDEVGPDSPASYHSTLLEFAKDSKGVFNPTQIKDEYVEKRKKIRVSFRVDGKKYSCTVENTGWFDNRVLDLVNDALEAAGAEQRFIPLPAVDQGLYLVFVPPSVYQAAVDRRLIPSDLQVDW